MARLTREHRVLIIAITFPIPRLTGQGEGCYMQLQGDISLAAGEMVRSDIHIVMISYFPLVLLGEMSSFTPYIQATHGLQSHGKDSTVIKTFGEIDYHLDQAAAEVISFQPSRPSDGFFGSHNRDVLPCTVVNWSNEHFSKKDLDAITAKYALHDDVWTPAFLQGEANNCHEVGIGHCLQCDKLQQLSYSNRTRKRRYVSRKIRPSCS